MPKVPCPICNKLDRVDNIKRHIENVHEKKKIFCGNCGIACSNKYVLKRHLENACKSLQGTRYNSFYTTNIVFFFALFLIVASALAEPEEDNSLTQFQVSHEENEQSSKQSIMSLFCQIE